MLDAGDLPGAVWLVRGLQSLPELPPALASFHEQALDFVTRCLPPPEGSPWWQLTYPVADVIDVVETVGVLLHGQRRGDPRVEAVQEEILARQVNGRWPLDRVPGKLWGSFGQAGQANKWVTIRVLRTLRAARPSDR